MKRIMILLTVTTLSFAGCASERFRVTVTDSDGVPVSNAVVGLGFRQGILFSPQGSHTIMKREQTHKERPK